MLAFPMVAIDTLSRLEAKGSITPGQRQADENFCWLFQRAGLDGLRAADMSRISHARRGHIERVPGHEGARRHIADIIDSLGGHGAVLASAAWHCCGLEWSVQRWALTVQRDRHVACGILIGALTVLEMRLGGRRRA